MTCASAVLVLASVATPCACIDRAVSEFVAEGMPRAMRPTPLPPGYVAHVFPHQLTVDEATVDPVNGAAVPVQRAHRPGEPPQRGAEVKPVTRDLTVEFIDRLGRTLQVDLLGQGQDFRGRLEFPAPSLLDEPAGDAHIALEQFLDVARAWRRRDVARRQRRERER